MHASYLQEQWVNPDDPWLWNGWQEVLFYSEGERRQRGGLNMSVRKQKQHIHPPTL